MEPNRKSNYSYIERVNDHRSCYRIKTNDGLKLELDKSEIGRFIPQKGMSVQIRLFNGTVLQEVFLNGICVVRRSPQKRLGDSVPVSKLSEKELMDAKQLALALRRDKRNRFKSVRDYQQSAVLSFKGNSAPYALRAQDAVERYLSVVLAG